MFIFKKCSYGELQAIQHREDLLLSGWTLLEKEYMDVTEKVYDEDGTMVALINYYFLNENKDRMMIALFEVFKPYRGRGLGKRIIAQFLQFRNALDAAWEDDMFRNLYPFNNFPNDCCGHTCDLLSQYLLEHGIETRQVNGTCSKDSQWHHVWLETEDGIVIDITGDQFIGRLVTAKEVEAVHVGQEGTVHKIFCVNRVPELTTIFTDPNEYTDFGGRPSAYQQRLIDVYEIVRSYL